MPGEATKGPHEILQRFDTEFWGLYCDESLPLETRLFLFQELIVKCQTYINGLCQKQRHQEE